MSYLNNRLLTLIFAKERKPFYRFFITQVVIIEKFIPSEGGDDIQSSIIRLHISLLRTDKDDSIDTFE